jgi:hypothetical protein
MYFKFHRLKQLTTWRIENKVRGRLKCETNRVIKDCGDSRISKIGIVEEIIRIAEVREKTYSTGYFVNLTYTLFDR